MVTALLFKMLTNTHSLFLTIMLQNIDMKKCRCHHYLLLKHYHAYQSYRNLSQKIWGNLLGGNHTLVVRYSLQTPMHTKCSDQIYNIAPQTALESLCRRPVFVKCLLHFRICSSNWVQTTQLPGSHQTNTYIAF